MITKKQVAAIKYLIFNSKDGNTLAKRILAFLLDVSEQLTKEVCITLTVGKDGFTEKEIEGACFDAMVSCNRNTHLNEIMQVANCNRAFSLHYGVYLTRGKFDANPRTPCYTFWLGKEHYSKTATKIPVTRKDLLAIDLEKPGLYPGLEKK